tara:strand:+ start:179 stop:493 length:315 start_codon:yes stop_codon:yes gene_type:complete
MDIKFKRLTEKFRHENQGFEYQLIERIGNVAWYEARYLGGSELKGYAVAKIRVKKGGKLPSGKVLPDYEEFPPESAFGIRADFYLPKSKAIAEKRFRKLVAEAK